MSKNLPDTGLLQTELLTLKEVAALLKVCVKTVRRIIKDNDVPIIRVRGQIRLRADHLPLLVKKKW